MEEIIQIGGYDCNFIEEPPYTLTCPVCLLSLREPHLISCCGKKVCNCCISRVQLAGQPCPFCRTPEFQTMIDRDVERQVLSLKVYCDNKEDGCTWIGELRQLEGHLDTCFYRDNMSCKYKCGLRCLRQQMLIHERDECELRPEIALTKKIDELTKKIVDLESTCKEQSLVIQRQQDILETHQLQSNNQYLDEQAYKLSEGRKELVFVGYNEHLQARVKKEVKNQVRFTANVNIDEMMAELTRRQEKIDELESKLEQLQLKSNDIAESTESDVAEESLDTKETAMNGLKNFKQTMTKGFEQIKRRVPDSFRSGQSSQRHSSQTNPPPAPYNPVYSSPPLVLHFPPQQPQPRPPQQPEPWPPQQPQPRPPQQPQPRPPQQPQPQPSQQPQPWPSQQPQPWPPQQPQLWPPQQQQLQPKPISRVCPICNLVYPMNVSQQDFEHHVNSHFQWIQF